MNIEESLLKEEQERTLTWAIENLERQREGIQERITTAADEFEDIKSRLDGIASIIDEMNTEKEAVDKKIDVATQRMAVLEEQALHPEMAENQSGGLVDFDPVVVEGNGESADIESVDLSQPQSYSALKINCRTKTIELIRQIALRTGISEATIMENAVAAVAQAIQRNDFRMHFPMNVKLVKYED